MKRFKELLNISLKSQDTEEWLDTWFTRPIGLVFALLWNRLGIHPNVITILGILLGMAGGAMFYFTDITHNIIGVILLMMANFCDSTDGQMARITGKKTLLGRLLDGFASDTWFFAIYVAIVLRLWNQQIPFTSSSWGITGFLLCALAGLVCHATQCALADYYRQIHLFFLLGEKGSELDDSASQYAKLQALPKHGAIIDRMACYFYGKYCSKQERLTPAFQRFYTSLRQLYLNTQDIPPTLRQEFRTKSLPLMKWANILTHNTRITVCYIACLADIPYVYPIFEITVLMILYVHMHHSHERLCAEMYEKYCA